MMSATDRPLRTRLLAALAVSMPLHVALAALLVELEQIHLNCSRIRMPRSSFGIRLG